MLGTAAMPHILTRYYTTPSVSETRRSVGWSLLFIVLGMSMMAVAAIGYAFRSVRRVEYDLPDAPLPQTAS